MILSSFSETTLSTSLCASSFNLTAGTSLARAPGRADRAISNESYEAHLRHPKTGQLTLWTESRRVGRHRRNGPVFRQQRLRPPDGLDASTLSFAGKIKALLRHIVVNAVRVCVAMFSKRDAGSARIAFVDDPANPFATGGGKEEGEEEEEEEEVVVVVVEEEEEEEEKEEALKDSGNDSSNGDSSAGDAEGGAEDNGEDDSMEDG
ncbi:hypothetical protein H0H81_011172 [Sphagnurus paluster]|uniref:Uncharacterized protein n=1 Tax=Sphagnurus paluster TaxID=117069 RepID=A0A9P7K3S8_9AGAR|nr:hypothetical protein H0H81_011172 [Sphagnurus paluster]